MPNALFVRCRVAAAARSSLTVRPSPDAFTYSPTEFAPEVPGMSNRRVSEGVRHRCCTAPQRGKPAVRDSPPIWQIRHPLAKSMRRRPKPTEKTCRFSAYLADGNPLNCASSGLPSDLASNLSHPFGQFLSRVHAHCAASRPRRPLMHR